MGTDGQGTLRSLADRYWDSLLEAAPRLATLLGDRRFDDRIEDLSVEAEEDLRRRWSGLRDGVDAIDDAGLAPDDRVTRALLRDALTEGIDALADRQTELLSDHMDGVHAQLLLDAPQVSAPTPESARALLARYRQVGTLLDQAAERFRAGVAAGRTPAQAVVARSVHQLDGYLASPLDDDPFVTLAGPEDWSDEGEWRAELRAVARDVIRPALARYRSVLGDELASVARPDERCGLVWLGADGEAMYARLLRQHTTLDDLDAATIHEMGRAEIERLAGEYAEVGLPLLGTAEPAAIFARLRDDPAFRYGDGAEIMADARRCLEAAEAAADRWFGRLPTTPCAIDVVPGYLAADAPAAYYYPPAADGTRSGTYLVNVAQPTERSRAETASVTFHEGVPGHHLQLAISTELTELPRFQRLSVGNTAFVEGWALYAERLADEMGLYAGGLDRLGMLANDSWRAARLVVDTGLHALGWSRQQAIDYMVANVPVGRNEIEVEVDRYIAIPGQATGYKVGQLEIQRRRDEVARAQGPAFDIRAFHDTVLGGGTVTLAALRMRVERLLAA